VICNTSERSLKAKELFSIYLACIMDDDEFVEEPKLTVNVTFRNDSF